MHEYGKTRKKYVFFDEDNLHAKLIVRLLEDGIKPTTLIRTFLNSYIEDDPNIRNWVESNKKIKISARTLAKRKAQQKKIIIEKNLFNLDQKEIDDIFDILADEFGE